MKHLSIFLSLLLLLLLMGCAQQPTPSSRSSNASPFKLFHLSTEITPHNIVSGPDGALWFTNLPKGKLGRITTQGTITEFPLPNSAGSGPTGITSGPDGALWFTDPDNHEIGRMTLPKPS